MGTPTLMTSLGLEHGYTDHLHDSETGLIYANARYLDPKTSRWLSSDPALDEYIPMAGQKADELRGMGGVFNKNNLAVYHYANNNPLIYSDPTGEAVLLSIAIGAFIGFAVSSSIEIINNKADNVSWKQAVKTTFTDPVSLTNIAIDTVAGGFLGGNAIITKAALKSVSSVAAKIAVGSYLGATNGLVVGGSKVAAKSLVPGQKPIDMVQETMKSIALGALLGGAGGGLNGVLPEKSADFVELMLGVLVDITTGVTPAANTPSNFNMHENYNQMRAIAQEQYGMVLPETLDEFYSQAEGWHREFIQEPSFNQGS